MGSLVIYLVLFIRTFYFTYLYVPFNPLQLSGYYTYRTSKHSALGCAVVCLVWLSQKCVYFPKEKRFIFIIDRHCVFCRVGTEFFTSCLYKFMLQIF